MLALNHDPPDLCLLSSYDYRHEPLVPSLKVLLEFTLSSAKYLCLYSLLFLSQIISGLITLILYIIWKNQNRNQDIFLNYYTSFIYLLFFTSFLSL
jgi:hypothetical protein